MSSDGHPKNAAEGSYAQADEPSKRSEGLREAQAPFVSADVVPGEAARQVEGVLARVSNLPKVPEKAGPRPTEDISPAEMRQLAALARRIMYNHPESRRALQKLGVNVTPANFYSEIPTLDELDASFEFGDGAPYDIPFLDAGAVRGAFDALVPFAADFDPPADQPKADDLAFYWRNPAFSFCDAMVYYAMIRKLTPSGVVEIGSGYSTRVAAEALRRNGRGSLTCVEPFPKDWLSRIDCTLEQRRAQDVTAEWMNDTLSDGDILFIDSTHTVKAGSDCLHIYLRMLPNIARDVTVHVHDIYLPFPFDKRQAVERQVFWTEQYLLLAFMLGNDRCRYLHSNVYGRHVAPEALERLMHGRYPTGGASWWFEWRGASRH